MIEGHHKMKNCVKGLQLLEAGERLLQNVFVTVRTGRGTVGFQAMES